MKTTPYQSIKNFLPIAFIGTLIVLAAGFLMASKSGVRLKKIELAGDTKTNKTIEIDTMAADTYGDLYLVNVTHNDASGLMTYGVMKRHGKDKEIVYEFPDPGKDKIYVSSGAYIMCVNSKSKEVLKRYSKPDILSNAKVAFASAELPEDLSCRPSDEE